METSPSRVSSGTVPISRRYMRTGSLVFSSRLSAGSCLAPGLVLARRSVGPTQLFLGLGIDQLDALGLEQGEDLFDLLRRGADIVRQHLIDLIYGEVPAVLAQGDQLPDFLVLLIHTLVGRFSLFLVTHGTLSFARESL